MDKVVRDIAKQTVKVATDGIVNEYLNKRKRNQGIEETHDPLRLVVNDLMTKVMRGIARDIGRNALGGVVYDYLIEAQFIGFFNNYYIRREVEHTVRDAMDDLVIGEIIEDYIERILREAVPVISESELQGEIKRRDKTEIVYGFQEYIDRCLMEIVIENMAKMYEDEEREIHTREQTDKKRRVPTILMLICVVG